VTRGAAGSVSPSLLAVPHRLSLQFSCDFRDDSGKRCTDATGGAIRGQSEKEGHEGHPAGLSKAETGIYGLDELTEGGLARGRTTVVCGGPGTGKTVLAVEFLVKGAVDFEEPGVLVTFEESDNNIAANVSALGWDLAALAEERKIAVDHVVVDPDVRDAGEWNLEGLALRIRAAAEEIGAKRLVLDTFDVMFTAMPDERPLRRSLRALFESFADLGLATVVTAERGEGGLTRHGLEEYVSDCVILLDQRVENQLATRRLRIVKYRGSPHGVDEFPFLIDDDGISILPATSLRLEGDAAMDRISTGVRDLDPLLSDGYYRGSTVLISGTPGSGKSTLAACFACSAAMRGERVLMVSFEESPAQIVRNMGSVGIRLQAGIEAGHLRLLATRPSAHGLETHLTRLRRDIDHFSPDHVVFDPVSAFRGEGTQVESMLSRLLDHVKEKEVTTVLTSLIIRTGRNPRIGISSIVDTWILLRNDPGASRGRRTLEVVKSRGMEHSDALHPFELTEDGPRIGAATSEGHER
jgi:circadian clock protein KaiC